MKYLNIHDSELRQSLALYAGLIDHDAETVKAKFPRQYYVKDGLLTHADGTPWTLDALAISVRGR